MRLLLGALVQPFLAAGLTYLAFPVIDQTGRPLYGAKPGDPADAALALALGVGIVAAVVTWVGAVPTAVWLMKRGTASFGRALWFGLAFGNLPVAIGTLLTGGGYGPAGTVRASVLGTCLGMSGAALFWVVSIPRSSDRRAAG
jgi:hypothetical protein